MRAKASPETRERQYLVVGPWRHWIDADSRDSVIGGVDFGAASMVAMHRQYRAWFDRWLRDDSTAIAAWPRVRLFAMSANRWLAADDWPIPGRASSLLPRWRRRRDALGEDAHPRGTGRRRRSLHLRSARPDPFVWSRNVDSGGPDDYREVEQRGDVLVHTMPVPAKPHRLRSGDRDACRHQRCPRHRLARPPLLVRADGRSQRLTEGWRRARTRRGGFRNDPLTPGTAETYTRSTCGGPASR
ncbi:MAG: hypothetical protein U0841_35305 [Chloroflexia bacterium]